MCPDTNQHTNITQSEPSRHSHDLICKSSGCSVMYRVQAFAHTRHSVVHFQHCTDVQNAQHLHVSKHHIRERPRFAHFICKSTTHNKQITVNHLQTVAGHCDSRQMLFVNAYLPPHSSRAQSLALWLRPKARPPSHAESQCSLRF